MKSLVLVFALLFTSVGVRAADGFVTLETRGQFTVHQFFASSTSVQGTVFQTSGIMLDFLMEAIGGTVDYVYQWSTGTYQNGTPFEIQVTSVNSLKSGESWSDPQKGLIKNATFTITGLGAGATAYLRVKLLQDSHSDD